MISVVPNKIRNIALLKELCPSLQRSEKFVETKPKE
jgi:hypothetical protein